jgi:HAD superfamily phosphoserine phosphatase-like hydrolase
MADMRIRIINHSINLMHSISVIIPTLNEEKAIGSVVRFALQSSGVQEVIVVDDKSIDQTTERAKEAGARVMTSTKLGKGASMRDALLMSKGDILLYLDGDIDEYQKGTIEALTTPIINNEADFVKATFNRDAGRVTELVAKPLLSILIPELAKFSQPLSGMVAGKKEFFMKVDLENDYGVDIGLLIDMHMLGARIKEVSIGHIRNKSKTWTELAPMAREVSRAILRRASRLPSSTLDSLETINIVRNQMDLAIKESLVHLKKMVVLDMDNTILRGRFIDVAAKEMGFTNALIDIRTHAQDHVIRTKTIAKLLKGKSVAELLQIVDSIAVVDDVVNVIERLKKRGYLVGIITDSFDCIAMHVQHRIGADFALANELEFSKSVATGEVKVPSFFMHTAQSVCNHNFCKSNAMLHIAAQNGIDLGNIVAMGDSDMDLCMITSAGLGVAFRPQDPTLMYAADLTIKKPSFKQLLLVAR